MLTASPPYPSPPDFSKSMDPLPRKPISSVPKCTNWAPFAFVIDSFLMRTPNYAIGNGDGSHLMLLDKFEYLTAGIGPDVAMIYFPVA